MVYAKEHAETMELRLRPGELLPRGDATRPRFQKVIHT